MESKGFLLSSKEFFEEMVEDGCRRRKVKANEPVKDYLVQVLLHHLDARNLFDSEYNEKGERAPQTLAEMFLSATQAQDFERHQLLKKLGDRTLYVSGFFGDSLSRKLVDVDYYVNMGGAAYGALASCAREDIAAAVYRTFSKRFLEFVDVLAHISHSAMVQNDQNILRLYDRYMRTGSEFAKEKLIEAGILSLNPDHVKLTQQD